MSNRVVHKVTIRQWLTQIKIRLFYTPQTSSWSVLN